MCKLNFFITFIFQFFNFLVAIIFFNFTLISSCFLFFNLKKKINTYVFFLFFKLKKNYSYALKIYNLQNDFSLVCKQKIIILFIYIYTIFPIYLFFSIFFYLIWYLLNNNIYFDNFLLFFFNFFFRFINFFSIFQFFNIDEINLHLYINFLIFF